MTYVRPNKLYPWNWNKRRFAIFKAYNYTCQLCGKFSKGNLHLHHIKPVGCGGTHHPKNLSIVCSHCHEFIHSGKYKGPLLDLRNCRKK